MERSVDMAVHIACNEYPWVVLYQQAQKNFHESLDAGLGEVAASGIDGFEPAVYGPSDADRLAPLLEKRGLEMRSIYVGSTLHDLAEARRSVESILAIAQKAGERGARILVTNPHPLREGPLRDKSDAQLETQAQSMNDLGKGLSEMGLTLAYHNHDVEFRHGAREFHHMMAGTDPRYVSLCLDAHWVYRGAGHSSVALFDILKLYGGRVAELHLRQSARHIWTETLGEGDIDYLRLARYLLDLGVRPHLVLEQAPESGTPQVLSAVEAHRMSCAYAREVFAGWRNQL
ncbi:MAG: sugar phosphate isomerase/epimerase [Armatimonadetes bacterium]|nr:sugar phosphate isomerase/epimerase [Armatimonadota bacterium]